MLPRRPGPLFTFPMALPTIAEHIANGMAAIRTDTTVAVTYAGNAYTGGRSMTRKSETYAPDGSVAVNDFTLILIKSELDDNGDTPAAQDLITVAGTEYRVNEVTTDPFGVHYHLQIGAAYP